MPGEGAVLDGAGLIRADDLADGFAGRDVLQDGDHVVLGEAPLHSRELEGLIDPVAARAFFSQSPAHGPMPTDATSPSERGRDSAH